jgi:hypothetical protein
MENVIARQFFGSTLNGHLFSANYACVVALNSQIMVISFIFIFLFLLSAKSCSVAKGNRLFIALMARRDRITSFTAFLNALTVK